VSIWLWCSRWFIIPYSYNYHDTSFSLFYFVVSKCEEWKEEAFLWSALDDSQHRNATAAEHAAVGFYLAGSKCKPNLWSITLIGLNIFFFASTTESRAIFFETFFYRISKFAWMKQLVTIFLFEIESSAFGFWKYLNLSPLNSKSLENSQPISCRVRRKVTRKDVDNVTKMAKLC